MSLTDHPGMPLATIFTVAGFLAGIERSHDLISALCCAFIFSVFWIPVLLTLHGPRH